MGLRIQYGSPCAPATHTPTHRDVCQGLLDLGAVNARPVLLLLHLLAPLPLPLLLLPRPTVRHFVRAGQSRGKSRVRVLRIAQPRSHLGNAWQSGTSPTGNILILVGSRIHSNLIPHLQEGVRMPQDFRVLDRAQASKVVCKLESIIAEESIKVYSAEAARPDGHS